MQPPLPVCTRHAGFPCRDILVSVSGLWVYAQGLRLGCVEPPTHTSQELQRQVGSDLPGDPRSLTRRRAS